MKKLIAITIPFLFLTFIRCQEGNPVEAFNYERDTPLWLKEKIDSMSNNQDYYGTKVFRYEWNKRYTYDILIPISSCAYCDVYDQQGNKIQFLSDRMFQDYINNRKNEVLVWEWNKDA